MLVLTDLDDNIIADENDRDVQDMITSAKVKGLDPSDWTNGYVKLQDTANLSKSAPVGHPFYGNQYKKIADLDADEKSPEWKSMSLMEKMHHLYEKHGYINMPMLTKLKEKDVDAHHAFEHSAAVAEKAHHEHVGDAEHDVDTDVDVSVPKPTLTFVPFHDLSLGDKKQHLVQEHGQSLGSVAGQTQGGLEGIHQGLVASASHFHQPEKKSKVPVVPFYSQMDLPTKQKHMAYEHGNYLEWLKHQTEGAMNTMHAADHALGGASMLPHTHTPAPTTPLHPAVYLPPSMLKAGQVIKVPGLLTAKVKHVTKALPPGSMDVEFESGTKFHLGGDEPILVYPKGSLEWFAAYGAETSKTVSPAQKTVKAMSLAPGDVVHFESGSHAKGKDRVVAKVSSTSGNEREVTFTDGYWQYYQDDEMVQLTSEAGNSDPKAEEAAKAEAAAKADMQAEEIAKNPQKWFQLSLGEKVNHLNDVEHAILPYGANIDALHGSIYDPLTCTLSPEYLSPEKRFDKQYAAATTLEDKLRLIQQEFLAPWWGQKSMVVPALEDIKTTEQADKLRKFLVNYRTNFHHGTAKENPLGRAVPGPKPSDFGGSHMPSLLEEDSKYSLEDLWEENWGDWHNDYGDDEVDNELNTSFKQLSAQRVAAEMVKLIPQSYIDRFLTGTSTANPVVSSSFVDAIQHPSAYWFTLKEGELRKWHKDTFLKEEIVNSAEIVSQEDIIDGTDTARLQKAKAEAVASQLIHNWAISSNDADAISLAIQEAAAKEFGVENITAGTDDWRLFDVRNRNWDALEKRTNLQTKINGRLFRAFVRAQYNATQEWFKENNITKITLFRKQSLPFNLEVSADGEDATFPLRPLSSWSYEPGAAENFSGRMMSITVPVSRVLSTTNSGNGCSNEHEIVLIGGTDTINILGEDEY